MIKMGNHVLLQNNMLDDNELVIFQADIPFKIENNSIENEDGVIVPVNEIWVEYKLVEYYSTNEAAQKALVWCYENKGWKRICDIENNDSLYKTWEELPEKTKSEWVNQFGQYDAKNAWGEQGERICKVPFGFITGKGEFYKKAVDVPHGHNLMMVYKVN